MDLSFGSAESSSGGSDGQSNGGGQNSGADLIGNRGLNAVATGHERRESKRLANKLAIVSLAAKTKKHNQHHALIKAQQHAAIAAATAALFSGHSSPGGSGWTAAVAAAASASASSSASSSDMNGPILYLEPNRTSAIDDIRSGVIYIFIATIFLSFFLILPGIRNDKFPTFLCITTSLLVTSIILIGLFGTTWHVGEAPQMSAAYKAFSRDRIQGELTVKIGLHSVNITLRAHKYYIIHEVEGPIVLMDTTMMTSNGQPVSKRANLLASLMPLSPVDIPSSVSIESALDQQQNSQDQSSQKTSSAASEFIKTTTSAPVDATNSNQVRASDNTTSETLTDELLDGRTSDGISVDTELESEEVFDDTTNSSPRLSRSSASSNNVSVPLKRANSGQRIKRDNEPEVRGGHFSYYYDDANNSKPKYTIKRVNHVDINYNERFYWIDPQQMRQEYQHALERGLPYPILTVVEYLSQDEAGFNWSRQYRLAGYYTSILLWLSAGLCVLMFCLHCAAPKYGIYTMQLIGCLLLATNLTYSLLVPRGDKELEIPFEGHALRFAFGPSFWWVLIGGCVSLLVGTIIVVIDKLFPDFIFTTVLDVDYDSHQDYYMKQKYLNSKKKMSLNSDSRVQDETTSSNSINSNENEKPYLPPFLMKKKSLQSIKQNDLPDKSRNNIRLSVASSTVSESKSSDQSSGSSTNKSINDSDKSEQLVDRL